ncbi:MAG TPA: imidazoleglycerol-phosphate dehydratase HisB [Anaeromyxobacter sp.]
MKPPPQPRSAGRRKSGDESARATARRGKVARRTKETSVEVDLRLAPGEARIATGLPFFDHMLEQISRHGGMALTVRAKGDLEVDAHHTVEDVGIGIGEALRQAVADKAGLARYGHAVVPLDEALVEAVVDLSGRPHLTFNAKLPSGKKFIGTYDVDLTQDFLQALVNHARVCLHVNVRYGRNLHHVVEAIFKATARALRAATAPQAGAGVPSTKGML